MDLVVPQEPAPVVEEEGPGIAAIGGVDVKVEGNTPVLEPVPQPDDLVNLVDGPFLRRSDHPDDGQDRDLPCRKAFDDFLEGGGVHAVVAFHGHGHQVLLADAENVHRLRPGVVFRLGNQDPAEAPPRHTRPADGETTQVLETPCRLHPVGEIEDLPRRKVQEPPVVHPRRELRQAVPDRLGNRLEIPRHPQAFVIGHGPPGCDVSPGFFRLVPHHTRQLAAHLDLQGRGSR